VFEGDLFSPLPRELRGRVDLLLVNAPYVPTDEISGMPPEARDYEPRVTLDGGTDGLDVHRRVAEAAPDWLAAGGTLLIEVSKQQAPVAAAIFQRAGLSPSIKRSTALDATVLQGLRT
jgi:release factor glutamine methyltransferase